MSSRIRLRRKDGDTYLERWGWECRWFGVFIHKMSAPDPGVHLHDHPWTFLTLILKGGYVEERALCTEAPKLAALAEEHERASSMPQYHAPYGDEKHRYPLSARIFRKREAHRIVRLLEDHSWSLVVHGPKNRGWGFYTAQGFIPEVEYDEMNPDRVEEIRPNE